jgi:hypothetical protein
MPMTFTSQITGDIPQFFDFVTDLFDEITGSWSPILFKQKFRQPILDAWNAIKATVPSVKDSFKNLVVTVQTKLLQDAGLIGKQLDLKFAGLNAAWINFLQNGTVGFLKDLLGWVNSLLGSLAAVLPQIEAWKEFKEAIEKLFEPTAYL